MGNCSPKGLSVRREPTLDERAAKRVLVEHYGVLGKRREGQRELGAAPAPDGDTAPPRRRKLRFGLIFAALRRVPAAASSVDGSRRRRGCHVDIPGRRVAATSLRGDASRRRRGCRADRPKGTGRGDAAAATWIFCGRRVAASIRGDASRRRRADRQKGAGRGDAVAATWICRGLGDASIDVSAAWTVLGALAHASTALRRSLVRRSSSTPRTSTSCGIPILARRTRAARRARSTSSSA